MLEYMTIEEFLIDLKKEFGRGDSKMIKIADLKRIEQGNKTMEEFFWEFRRATRSSGYEGRPLLEEFKQEMNGIIRTYKGKKAFQEYWTVV